MKKIIVGILILAAVYAWGAASDYKVVTDGTVFGYTIVSKLNPADVRAYMDGVSGRPTYATWLAAQTTTNVSGSIQAAIDAVKGSRGIVKLPAGTLHLHTPITIDNDYVTLQGAGRDVTLITIDSANANAINVTGLVSNNTSYVTLRDFKVNRSTTSPTGGSGIYAQFTEYLTIEDVDTWDHKYGVYIDRCQYFRAVRVHARRQAGADTAYGFYVDCTNNVSASTYFDHCVAIFTPHTGTSTGFYVGGDYTQDKWFVNCGVEVADYGFYIYRSAFGSYGAFDIGFTECYADSIDLIGFYGENLNAAHFNGTYTLMAGTGVANYGISLKGATSTSITGGVHWGIGNPGFHTGVLLDTCYLISVVGNSFYGVEYGVNVSQGGEHTISGNNFYQPVGNPAAAFIETSGTTKPTYCTVTGNVMTSYADYGIALADGADYWTIVGNSITPTNITTPISVHVNNTNVKIRDNNGFVTENSGYSSAIANGGTIAHGLVAAPTFVSVQPVDTGLTNIYIGSDATNITVYYTGGGTHQFFWKANTKWSK